MSSLISLLQNAPHPHWRDYFDILLVTYLTYRVVRLIRGTRAWTVLMGILAFSAALWLAHLLGLRALSFLLDRAAMIGPVALLVVFLPEVRQWVMEMGTGSFWRGQFMSGAGAAPMLDEIIQAVEQLSHSRHGALIVIEGRVGLDDIAASGRRLDSAVSAELLETLFYPGTALHDGAVVLRDSRAIAAGCVLPMPPTVLRGAGTAHTRHQAALELAQQTDALVIVVSEETGSISLASNRSLIKGLTSQQLRERLFQRLGGAPAARFQLFRR
ncbi:MAG: diadenylate cyclase CdaA [Chloroflexi bacterium]|nr:diadenylate cyclase CdaA [Chloroflexota bacterium]